MPFNRFPVPPADIDSLFLTHAHIDHIGRVPDLIDAGFCGEIICTHGTKALLLPMLRDAMSFSGQTDPQVRVMEKQIDDLGCKNTPIIPDPDPPDACDLLILESTYGDRNHTEKDPLSPGQCMSMISRRIERNIKDFSGIMGLDVVDGETEFPDRHCYLGLTSRFNPDKVVLLTTLNGRFPYEDHYSC